MGIINITPDSFSRDGLKKDKDYTQRAIRLARQFIAAGADVLDIGGESTRPGAPAVAAREEIRRIVPVIRFLSSNFHLPVSVDTTKAAVARAALQNGASIINTTRGCHPSLSLLKTVARHNAALILMHSRGTPRTMQKKIFYRDVLREITVELRNSIEICLEIGIKSDKIMVDPGIGFSKTPEHNLEILNRLPELARLNYPILIGTSRKSFIGHVLDRKVPERLLGTAATVTASILRGAHMVRVHDVAAMRDITVMTDAILNQQKNHPRHHPVSQGNN